MLGLPVELFPALETQCVGRKTFDGYQEVAQSTEFSLKTGKSGRVAERREFIVKHRSNTWMGDHRRRLSAVYAGELK